jgi:hypothetical protein
MLTPNKDSDPEWQHSDSAFFHEDEHLNILDEMIRDSLPDTFLDQVIGRDLSKHLMRSKITALVVDVPQNRDPRKTSREVIPILRLTNMASELDNILRGPRIREAAKKRLM